MKKKRNGNYSSPSIEVYEIETESLLDMSPIEGEGGNEGNTGEGEDDGSGDILSKGRNDFYEW